MESLRGGSSPADFFAGQGEGEGGEGVPKI